MSRFLEHKALKREWTLDAAIMPAHTSGVAPEDMDLTRLVRSFCENDRGGVFCVVFNGLGILLMLLLLLLLLVVVVVVVVLLLLVLLLRMLSHICLAIFSLYVGPQRKFMNNLKLCIC